MSEFLGPCSCADEGQCKHNAAGPLCMQCPACKGAGSGRALTNHLGPDDYEIEVTCPVCNGTGAAP